MSYISEGVKDFSNPFTPAAINPYTVSQSVGTWGCPFDYILVVWVCVSAFYYICVCLLKMPGSPCVAVVGMGKCE